MIQIELQPFGFGHACPYLTSLAAGLFIVKTCSANFIPVGGYYCLNDMYHISTRIDQASHSSQPNKWSKGQNKHKPKYWPSENDKRYFHLQCLTLLIIWSSYASDPSDHPDFPDHHDHPDHPNNTTTQTIQTTLTTCRLSHWPVGRNLWPKYNLRSFWHCPGE